MSRDRRPGPAAGSLLLCGLLLATAARADVRITLLSSFIEKYKDRATLGAVFTVDKAHPRPHPPASDGDLLAAGRAPEIGLAAVAEVMNAALEPEAVALIHQAERSGQPLQMRGVWRLWCEHGGDAEHVQDQPLQPGKTANPPHVFELHPLVKIGDQDVAASLQPIAGFTYKDAGQAFNSYEQLASHISIGDGTVTVTTRMAGFNYVEFVISLNEEPTHLLPDGLSVKAAILDTGGELLVHERRMVAVAGTAPYARLKSMHQGEALHVIGIPRLDLSLLSWRVANSARVPGILDWSLPYEMVLVAAFADTPTGPDVMPPPAPAPAVPAAAAAAAADGAAGEGSRGPGALPAEPVALAVPALPAPDSAASDGDVVTILLRLLGDSLPAGAVRGACTFSTGQRSYCAALGGPQCDQLGGAWNAGEECPASPGTSSSGAAAPAAPPAAAPSPPPSPPPPPATPATPAAPAPPPTAAGPRT